MELKSPSDAKVSGPAGKNFFIALVETGRRSSDWNSFSANLTTSLLYYTFGRSFHSRRSHRNGILNSGLVQASSFPPEFQLLVRNRNPRRRYLTASPSTWIIPFHPVCLGMLRSTSGSAFTSKAFDGMGWFGVEAERGPVLERFGLGFELNYT